MRSVTLLQSFSVVIDRGAIVEICNGIAVRIYAS